MLYVYIIHYIFYIYIFIYLYMIYSIKHLCRVWGLGVKDQGLGTRADHGRGSPGRRGCLMSAVIESWWLTSSQKVRQQLFFENKVGLTECG